jgi:hypothetical protein
MAAPFVSGTMQEYISNIDFSLNFEDKTKSVKVRIGEIVVYDGNVARYRKPTGEEIVGKTPYLKSAIASNWLTLNVPGVMAGPTNLRTDRVRDVDGIVYKAPDYDSLKGGSFNEFIRKDPDTIVAGVKKVETEDDRIIKKTEFKAPANKPTPTGKMEVAGDQVAVKDISTTVSNSTSTVSTSKAAKASVILQADDGQAEHVIISKKKGVAAGTTDSKVKTFTVDNMTPAVPEDSTLNEVKKATTSFDGSQDGRVIKKIGEKSKMPPEPTEVEGIVLKKTDFSAKLPSGSTPVADLSGVKTQDEVNAIEKEIEKKGAPQLVEKKNYIDMLPDNWSEMHWVKKEKFIMAIDDIEFLKFIMKVESIKAVHAACRKRMTELAKKSSNG